MVFLGRKLIFQRHQPKIVAIVTGHQKDNSFVLTHCMAGLWGGGRVHFWPKIDPKNCLFSCYTL